jgi:predicted PurR-regulated permease PerM
MFARQILPVRARLAEVAPPEDHADARGRRQRIAMGALAAGLLLLGLYTVRHFLAALAWAGVLAIALWPVYARAVARFGTGRRNIVGRRNSVLPAAFTLAAGLIFVLPILLVGTQLAREVHLGIAWLHGAQQNGIPEPEALRTLPWGRTQVQSWWQANLANPDSARALVQRLTSGRAGSLGRAVGEQLARRLTLFGLTLLTLFFLFRDGQTLTRQMRQAGERTFGLRGERVGRQIVASVHGTVNGLVLVGLGEGAVLGVVYFIAGVPHATVLGALTALAAMVPFAAPAVILIAALLLVAQGALAWGIGVFCIGIVVTFLADHFVRPALIGGATRLPFIWVLLGILGGLEAWGLVGLFLGPAIMAALIMLWRDWACGEPI